MTPVVIPSAGGDCFAIYTPGPGLAVLMCPPFGDEALKTARVWRDLALRLGANGLASLRIDLPGTGNSAADPVDPGRVEAWRAAIKSSADWLAARHAGRIALFGHRFGALLALDAVGLGIAAERLILLDPPASGAAQARLLRARARLGDGLVPPEGADYIQAGGVPLSTATLRDIATLPASLHGSTLPPSLWILLGTSPWPDRLRALGSAVETTTFDGHAAFVPQDAFRAIPPAAVLDRVIDYLLRAAGEPASSATVAASCRRELDLPGLTETPIRFGPGDQLFGILCQPKCVSSGPGILLPTTGADPCSGMSRLWTELARRLAREGVTSLRFDMRGIGESDGANETSLMAAVYAPERVDDLRSAVDVMSKLGFDSVRVVGYCAGAYAVWNAALHDPRIAGLLVGNLLYLNRLPTFTDDVLKLRPGQSRFGLGRNDEADVLSARVSALIRRLDDGARRFIPRQIRVWLRRWSSDPTATRRHLAALVARGCAVSFVMSRDDHGHIRLRQAFGERPALPSGVELTVISGADHEFSNRHHRQKFLELAASFALQGRIRPTVTPQSSRPARIMENA